MNIPGFTAEASLSNPSARYQAARQAIDSPMRMTGEINPAAKGQSFPGTTCTCQECGPKGGDVTGPCPTVCKDKTVNSKGSLPHDYCKASSTRPPEASSWSVEFPDVFAIDPGDPVVLYDGVRFRGLTVLRSR